MENKRVIFSLLILFLIFTSIFFLNNPVEKTCKPEHLIYFSTFHFVLKNLNIFLISFFSLFFLFFKITKNQDYIYLEKLITISLVSFIVTASIVLLIKYTFQIQRPCFVFNSCENIHFDPWSFPSGHAAHITALLLPFILLGKRRKTSVLFLFIIALVSLSRWFFCQHTLVDIYVGILFGYIISHCTFQRFEKKINSGVNFKE